MAVRESFISKLQGAGCGKMPGLGSWWAVMGSVGNGFKCAHAELCCGRQGRGCPRHVSTSSVPFPQAVCRDWEFRILCVGDGAELGWALLKSPCLPFRKVKPAEAETAGNIMSFFLCLGLALGAVLSFLLRALG